MPFLDESHNFTNGFECGQIWERMSKAEVIKNQVVHVVNVEQIKLMAEYWGYEATFKDYDDTWTYLTACQVDISQLLR